MEKIDGDELVPTEEEEQCLLQIISLINNESSFSDNTLKYIKECLLSLSPSLVNIGLPLLDHVIKTDISHNSPLFFIIAEYLSKQDDTHVSLIYDKLMTLYQTTGNINSIHLLHILITKRTNLSLSLLHTMITSTLTIASTTSINGHMYNIVSLLLPYMVIKTGTPSIVVKYMEKVWSLNVSIEGRPIDVCLTLLCCLVHIFIPGKTFLIPRNLASSDPSSNSKCVSDSFNDSTSYSGHKDSSTPVPDPSTNDIEQSSTSPLDHSNNIIPVSDLSTNIRLDSNPVYDIRCSSIFWDIIQYGLVDIIDPLNRKRALFLLDAVLESVERGVTLNANERCVFRWSCHDNSNDVWSDTVLLLETLEEKQVHIVNPVLDRLPKLIKATKTLINGQYYQYDVSWLMVIMRRVFVHDARSIVRRGVRELLTSNIEESPFIEENNWKVLFDPLLNVFTNSWIFARENHSNTASLCPPLVQYFHSFLNKFINELPKDKRINFFSFFLSTCISKQLPDITLVYMSYSLSLLSPSLSPLIDDTSLHTFKLLVNSGSSVHRHSHRSAFVSFLLTVLCQHCDYKSINYLSLFITLHSFSNSQCLVRGSHSWTQACQLIYNKHFTSPSPTEDDSLHSFLKTCTSSLLDISDETPQNKETSVQTSYIHSPDCVAMAMIMSFDACAINGINLSSNEKESLSDSLTSLLSPLLSLIATSRERVYMNTNSLINTVKCVAYIVMRCVNGIKEKCDKVTSLIYKTMLPWLPVILTFLHDTLLSECFMDSVSSPFSVVSFISQFTCSLYTFLSIYGWNSDQCGWSLNSLVQRAAQLLIDITNNKDNVIELSLSFLGSVSILEWILLKNNNDSSLLLTTTQYDELAANLSSLPLYIKLIKPETTSLLNEEYGPVIGQTLSSYWTILKCVLQLIPPTSAISHVTLPVIGACDVEVIANACVDHFDVLDRDLATPLNCLASIVPQIIAKVGVSFLLPIIERVWPLVLSLKDHLLPLLNGLQGFVNLTFHSDLVGMGDKNVIDMHIKYGKEIFSLSEYKTGVCNVLVHHFSTVLSSLYTITETTTGNSGGTTDTKCTTETTGSTTKTTDTTTETTATTTETTDTTTETTATTTETTATTGTATAGKSDKSNNFGVVVSERIKERVELFTHMCTFGPVFKKNVRVLNDVDQFINSLKEVSHSIGLSSIDSDSMVRVRTLSLLVELLEREGKEGTIQNSFLPVFIENIINKLKELNINKPRYYINSYCHRYRLRLIQSLLVLYKYMNESMVIKVVMVILDCLEIDNQLSVRYCMEWLITLCFYSYPSLWRNLLLPQLDIHVQNTKKRRLSRLCSIFTIIVQLGKCLPSDNKYSYYNTVMPLVFQWCMCHHFVVRVYAVGSLVHLYNQWTSTLVTITSDKELHTDERQDSIRVVPSTLSFVEQFIPFIHQYSDIARSKKLDCNVFLTIIHPLMDYNIEVIFHILPALTDVLEEEWIYISLFKHCSPSLWSSPRPIPLQCTNTMLLESFNKILRQPLIDDKNEEQKGEKESQRHQLQKEDNYQKPRVSNDPISSGEDIQKKITPWRSSSSTVLSQELFPSSLPLSSSFSHSPTTTTAKEGLILVASLINKAPNLGGLCRTSEVFGVSELVISSSAMVEEKEFKSLSVTAEKWINITQVKPDQLKEYLLQMRYSGYKLIGVEQTAHSKCITQYSFPKKTLLLLGNEREGIPVQLIHLLDHCVEIPQYGTIRSLNVHVSGALVVWEYTKQQRLDTTNV